MDQMRRKLLSLGVLTAATAALPLDVFCQYAAKSAAAAPFAPSNNEYDALASLTIDDFKRTVGASFEVQSQASSFTRMLLSEVQDPPVIARKKTVSAAPGQELFALRFKMVSGPLLKQGTYLFETSSLVRFALFVVPSAAGQKPVYYTGLLSRATQ